MDKILFVKLGSLGDVLLTTPAASLLKKNIPDLKIDFLTSSTCSKVLENNPSINEIIKVEPLQSSGNIFVEICKATKLCILLLKHRKTYKGVFLFHRSIILNLLFRIMLGDIIYSYSSNAVNDFLLKKKIAFNLRLHRIIRSLELVQLFYPALKWKDEDLRLLFVPREEGDLQLPFSPYVAIAPGGGKNIWSEMPSRRWPVEYFAELANRIINELNLEVVIIGGKDDLVYADKIVELVKSERLLNRVGKYDINETANILKKAKLFVGNDSFPLFLASAVGSSTIGLFGPTNGALINPLGSNHTAIQSTADCSSCYNPMDGVSGLAYQCKKQKCMSEISVDAVYTKAKELLLR